MFYNSIQPGHDSSEICGKCNSREEAGQAFDTMKGWMESELTYQCGNGKMKGFFPIAFPALRAGF